jgi:hypothetical protein
VGALRVLATADKQPVSEVASHLIHFQAVKVCVSSVRPRFNHHDLGIHGTLEETLVQQFVGKAKDLLVRHSDYVPAMVP